MYIQYPLETLARNRGMPSQIEFAREAKRVLFDSDELLSEPANHGLAIFAANEQALMNPARVLRDVFGALVELRGPKVRYMPGDPMQEPIMHVRITVRREYASRVLAELRARGARILEECHRPRIYIVRAESALATLLGLPARLDVTTGGSADCVVRLIRYAPVHDYPDGPGGLAA